MIRRTRPLWYRDAVDYHRVLNVSRDASKKDIKTSYRQLVKELHPDVNKSADAPARFKAVQEAYDVLMDDARRAAAAMDAGGSDGAGGPFAGGSGWTTRTAAQAAADAARRQQARDLHRTLTWFELLVHPRILFGILPLAVGVYYFLNPSKTRQPETHEILAWYNEKAKRWETPAPWNAAFRALNPELKKVDRRLVHDSSRAR